MIINKESLFELEPIVPMHTSKMTHTDPKGRKTSYGLVESGYDVRLGQDIWLFPGRRFVLASTFEYFDMPNNLMGMVMNKSTWARMGVDVSRSTNLEGGWQGWLTLEITYSKLKPLKLYKGCGIAQIIFHEIAHPVNYSGKYNSQPNKPVPAKF